MLDGFAPHLPQNRQQAEPSLSTSDLGCGMEAAAFPGIFNHPNGKGLPSPGMIPRRGFSSISVRPDQSAADARSAGRSHLATRHTPQSHAQWPSVRRERQQCPPISQACPLCGKSPTNAYPAGGVVVWSIAWSSQQDSLRERAEKGHVRNTPRYRLPSSRRTPSAQSHRAPPPGTLSEPTSCGMSCPLRAGLRPRGWVGSPVGSDAGCATAAFRPATRQSRPRCAMSRPRSSRRRAISPKKKAPAGMS